VYVVRIDGGEEHPHPPHFRVLREAGVVRQWDVGNAKLNALRADDLRVRFPGLLDAILSAKPVPDR
jgi:hypothetical protein